MEVKAEGAIVMSERIIYIFNEIQKHIMIFQCFVLLYIECLQFIKKFTKFKTYIPNKL